MDMTKRLFLFGIAVNVLSWTAAMAVAGEPLLIVKVIEYQLKAEKSISLDRVAWSFGSPPVLRHSKEKTRNAPYELQVLNSKGETLHTKFFDFVRHLEVPLTQPIDKRQDAPSRIALKEPEAVLVLPYFPEGTDIRVRGRNKKTAATAIPAIPEAYKSQKKSYPAPAQEGNFYVLLMASGFNSSTMNDFHGKAQAVKELLSSQEPFVFYKKNVNIAAYENTDNLGCYSGCYNIDRLMCCDSMKVMAAAGASGQLYDEIIIIHNTATYSGGGTRDFGIYQDNSASTFCQLYNGSYTVPMALHEFGHSFGNLCDEYTYSGEEYAYYDCANCRASCLDWSGISASCQLGCDARSDYYRPEDSTMVSLDILNYNLPSIHNSLLPRLKYFIPTAVPSGTFTPGIFHELLLRKKMTK